MHRWCRQPLHRVGQVARVRDERVGQGAPERRGGTPWPEQQVPPRRSRRSRSPRPRSCVRPTFHPVGSMMLNRMIDHQGEPGLPGGERDHRRGHARHQHGHRGAGPRAARVWPPTPIMMAEPTTKPTAVPPTARRAVEPVPKGVGPQHRQGASTTQKPCSTSVISTTATARASPAAPRTALRNHTERNERWETSRRQQRTEELSPVAPKSGDRRGWAPAASSAASATIAVAMPSARAWKLGSKVAMIPRVAIPIAGHRLGRRPRQPWSAGAAPGSMSVDTSTSSSPRRPVGPVAVSTPGPLGPATDRRRGGRRRRR